MRIGQERRRIVLPLQILSVRQLLERNLVFLCYAAPKRKENRKTNLHEHNEVSAYDDGELVAT